MSEAPEPRKTLDPDQVAFWLARHPDFFVGREGLLQQLKVPHSHIDGAVSLLERLVLDLRTRAESAEGRLDGLLGTARQSEAQYRRLRETLLALVEAPDRDALAQALATQMSERFATPAVALWCAPELSDAEAAPPQPPRQVLTHHAGTRLAALLDGRTSRCAKLGVSDWKCLLPHTAPPKKPGSCAITRLAAGDALGYLLLASPDPEQYRVSMDTQFTEYLGDIVARLLVRLAPHE